jgi:multiple sugar transport system substrate-binding protein
VGAEADVLETQLTRFVRLHPGIHVVRQTTPDAADQRHQLYVQWLNAGASAPDIVQLDVIWTPEFAAAGWLMPLDHFRRSERPFFRYDDPDLGTPIALLVLAFQRRIVRTFAGLA